MPTIYPPRRKIGTTETISQKCLPGGPRSATYDASTYTYLESNTGVGPTSLLQPSILAMDGDTQVGGYLYNSESGDSNYNRGKFPQPHTITEKAFYTEVASRYNKPGPYFTLTPGGIPLTEEEEEELFQNGRIWLGENNRPFLRVDLTEGGKVFRHNTVIVRGTIECVNNKYIDFSKPLGEEIGEGINPDRLWGTVDFEWIFTCHPLSSKIPPLQSSYTEGVGQLSTLHTSYIQYKNQAYGSSGPEALIESGDLQIFTPGSSLMGGWTCNFGLQSVTKSHPDNINITPTVLKEFSPGGGIVEYTPYSHYLTDDENEQWDLNVVEFRFPVPWLDDTPVIHKTYDGRVIPPRFAIKGTYLLI